MEYPCPTYTGRCNVDYVFQRKLGSAHDSFQTRRLAQMRGQRSCCAQENRIAQSVLLTWNGGEQTAKQKRYFRKYIYIYVCMYHRMKFMHRDY
jgi:hypothetical protein